MPESVSFQPFCSLNRQKSFENLCFQAEDFYREDFWLIKAQNGANS